MVKVNGKKLLNNGEKPKYLEVDLVDVNKPSLLHPLPLQPVPQNGKRTSHLGPGHPAHVAPYRHGRVRPDAPVVADVVDLDLGGLDPAAGRARGVGLADQGRPVRDAAEEVAHVDEVKGVLGPGPGLGAVVDLEAHVWGHPGRLDRGEVGPCYLGGGELVCEVAGALSSVPDVAAFGEGRSSHGPDAGPGSHIQSFLVEACLSAVLSAPRGALRASPTLMSFLIGARNSLPSRRRVR